MDASQIGCGAANLDPHPAVGHEKPVARLQRRTMSAEQLLRRGGPNARARPCVSQGPRAGTSAVRSRPASSKPKPQLARLLMHTFIGVVSGYRPYALRVSRSLRMRRSPPMNPCGECCNRPAGGGGVEKSAWRGSEGTGATSLSFSLCALVQPSVPAGGSPRTPAGSRLGHIAFLPKRPGEHVRPPCRMVTAFLP